MKKVFMLVTILVAGLVFMPKVNALSDVDIETLEDYTGKDQVVITSKKDNYFEAELRKDLSNPGNPNVQGYDLGVPSGQTVVLDLKGHKFLSFSGTAIEIAPGGTLIIKDSVGEGIIELSSISKGNNISTIINNGNLTIEGGKVVSEVAGNAAVVNEGILTINGGQIETKVNSAWGLTNLKTATINNGTFTQGGDYSVIQNSGEMTINNGKFETSGSGVHNSLITNNKGISDEDVKLTIANGDFESNLILYNGEDSIATITGGNFQNPDNVVKYLANGLHFDNDGNVVKDAEVVSTPSNINDNPDTSDINLYLLISILGIGTLGFGYVIKRRFN